MKNDDDVVRLLHGITGCDTVGGFAGISKEFWFRRFLEHEINNKSLIPALCDTQQNAPRSITVQIGGLVCRAYLFPRSKPNVGQSYEIGNTRYRLLVQRKYEGEKLPPTKGALKKHLLRAHMSSAHLTIIPEHEPKEFGWDLQGKRLCCTNNRLSYCTESCC